MTRLATNASPPWPWTSLVAWHTWRRWNMSTGSCLSSPCSFSYSSPCSFSHLKLCWVFKGRENMSLGLCPFSCLISYLLLCWMFKGRENLSAGSCVSSYWISYLWLCCVFKACENMCADLCPSSSCLILLFMVVLGVEEVWKYVLRLVFFLFTLFILYLWLCWVLKRHENKVICLYPVFSSSLFSSLWLCWVFKGYDLEALARRQWYGTKSWFWWW